MKKPLVIANWKLYVTTELQAKTLVTALARKASILTGASVWIAPSFTLLPVFAKAKKTVFKWGAQNAVSYQDDAHTGEVSVAMLKDAKATFALVGHSEQRARGVSDASIAAALRALVIAGVTGVLCIGEKERDHGGEHFEVITEQLNTALNAFPSSGVSKLIIAYEPVWAIGKTAQEAMQPAELHETIIFIRKTLVNLLGRDVALKIPILYGGSVEPSNTRALLAAGSVSGFLVGHASASLTSFADILAACKK